MSANQIQGSGSFLGARYSQNGCRGASSAPTGFIPTAGSANQIRPDMGCPVGVSLQRSSVPQLQERAQDVAQSSAEGTYQVLVAVIQSLVQMLGQVLNAVLGRNAGQASMIGAGGDCVPTATTEGASESSQSWLSKIRDFVSDAGELYSTVKDVFSGKPTSAADSGEATSTESGSGILGDLLGIGAGFLFGRAKKIGGAVKKAGGWLFDKGKDLVSKGLSWVGSWLS